MLKKQFFVCLITVLGFLQLGTASAALLSFSPSSQSVSLGDNVSVDLRISELGDEILTGFDLNISFDDSILGFQSFTFGSGLDLFGLGSIQDVDDSLPGLVNVFEISFESDDDLKDFQPNDFILGTFNFSALSIGTSALSITAPLFGVALVGELASELDMQVQDGSVSVVPIPAAIWLFGTGLIGLVGFSKRGKAVSKLVS